MKKLLFLIPILFLAGCFFQPFFKAETKFGSSKNRLTEKYNLAKEIKSKYQLDGASLKRAVKDDFKDMVRVELGDKDATEFIPNLTISRWDEVSFKIKPKLDTIASKDKAVNFNGDKVEFTTPKVDYKMYELPVSAENPEGAFEFEIDLKEKPLTNVIELDIETQGLDFFYQPALNIEMASSTCTETDCDGWHRPENIVGSYVVYASENKTNWKGGKEYKTGQVGVIYRPKIIDAIGKEFWGEFNKDLNKTHILSVKLPNGMIYPIRHAAGLTFGYTTVGASDGARGNNDIHGVFGVPANEGTVDSVSMYAYDAAANFKGIIVASSTLTIISNGISNATAVPTSYAWATSTFSVAPSVTAQRYFVCWIESASISGVKYNSVGGTQAWLEDTTNNYTTPTDPTDATFTSNVSWSIYATYTASGGGETAPAPDDGLIIFDE